MNEKLQAELQQITENFNMGFISPFEAMMQSYDALMCAAGEIEDEKKRDDEYARIYKLFMDEEHLQDAWCAISQKINA